MMIARVVFTGVFGLAGSTAWACPNCSVALDQSSPQTQAYFLSIVFMLVTILTLFAGVVSLLMWLSRREQQTLRDAGYTHLLDNAVATERA
jgi:heme/copper-type cytochrome/quinol oxidase subunit 2